MTDGLTPVLAALQILRNPELKEILAQPSLEAMPGYTGMRNISPVSQALIDLALRYIPTGHNGTLDPNADDYMNKLADEARSLIYFDDEGRRYNEPIRDPDTGKVLKSVYS